ncbi:DUF2637 domain-containing protein [Streptomyces sp. NPDC049040]|uniref:DUF2637 domain-containing protein n=1 Tax=Streptomyces sp. NPDC049040 TaxID=3365593 RepID=UPI00371237AE
MAGMATAAASAAVASFTGLRGLALDTGWPPRLAWLLPVTLDAYAMTSACVWLAATTRAGRPGGSHGPTRSARSGRASPATRFTTPWWSV